MTLNFIQGHIYMRQEAAMIVSQGRELSFFDFEYCGLH